MNISTNYVPMQPPYKVIKHGRKIGLQVGTQIVTIVNSDPIRMETHNYPVVAVENETTALERPDYSQKNNFEHEVWDNIESKNVSVLCEQGIQLKWSEINKILWHDHARLGNDKETIQKWIINKLLHYNRSIQLPEPGLHYIHLSIKDDASGTPIVVKSAHDDIFALNVKWQNDPSLLEKSLVSDLTEYLLYISPGRSAVWWQMVYTTQDERLYPVVRSLNANPVATKFKRTLMNTITISALLPYEETSNNTPPPPGESHRTYKIFHPNLDEQEIVTALLRTDRLSLGPKQYALAVQEFFQSIGWLVNMIDTQFVSWMKDKQIMNAAANDLQHVNRTEKMDTLKENLRDTFQFKNSAGLWEDRGDFYRRKDSKKINSGKPRIQ